MITTPTVFILGAGASEPYGFPVGSKLKDQIVSALGSGRTADHERLEEVGASELKVATFATDLRQSGLSSVDAFLEHRTDLLDVGKKAIAQALIPKEHLNNLFMLRNPRAGRDDPALRDWYTHLWGQMNTSFDQLGANEVSFVTFNYDRSLEAFLAMAIYSTHKHGHTREECEKAVAHFPVVHVYGSLGSLPWQDRFSRTLDYAPDLTPENIRRAAASIKILSETDANTPEFEKARTLIKKAVRVVFLGFGYGASNVRRLHMPTILAENVDYEHRGAKLAVGTAYGLETAERKIAQSMITSLQLGGKGEDALLFLRRCERLVD